MFSAGGFFVTEQIELQYPKFYVVVFIVQDRPEEILFGETYPPREVYPANKDFGKTAICFSNRENAERKYEKLTKRV